MQYVYFPVRLDQMGAKIRYHELFEGDFRLGDVRVRTQYLNHTALTLGIAWRLTAQLLFIPPITSPSRVTWLPARARFTVRIVAIASFLPVQIS